MSALSPRAAALSLALALAAPLGCKGGSTPAPELGGTPAGSSERPPAAAGEVASPDGRETVKVRETRALLEGTKTRAEGGRLGAPKYLPAPARDLIWERMQGHGTDMTLLLWSVLFLDYDGAAELSRAILGEPRFSRPLGQDDPTLNALLPEEFFTLQDELVERARALAEVASADQRSGTALSTAYGRLAETCVKCHSVYLEERKLPEGPEPRGDPAPRATPPALRGTDQDSARLGEPR